MGDGTHAEQALAHPPLDLLTDQGSGDNRRLKVEPWSGTYYYKLISVADAITGSVRARWEERP